MRRKKVNPGDVGTKVDFTDQNGDTWQEYAVLHHEFKNWMLNHYSTSKIPSITEDMLDKLSNEDLTKIYSISPWFKSTANDISWEKRVELQSVIQKYISHSISSTINLPENTTVDQVNNIYFESWKKGLKGVTVYRDNCRTGVLVTDTSEFKQNNAPKRDKILPAKIHVSKCMGEEFIIVLGMLENKPYEVFAQNTKWLLNDTFFEGDITKVKKGIYRLEIKDIYTIENFGESMTDEQSTVCRLVSTSLRHGADIKFIVEQLNKTPGTLKSFGKVLARTLKKYIPDGDKVTGARCNDCDSENIIYQEGCQQCRDCGSSKCG